MYTHWLFTPAFVSLHRSPVWSIFCLWSLSVLPRPAFAFHYYVHYSVVSACRLNRCSWTSSLNLHLDVFVINLHLNCSVCMSESVWVQLWFDFPISELEIKEQAIGAAAGRPCVPIGHVMYCYDNHKIYLVNFTADQRLTDGLIHYTYTQLNSQLY